MFFRDIIHKSLIKKMILTEEINHSRYDNSGADFLILFIN
jgi:hypothetical protein